MATTVSTLPERWRGLSSATHSPSRAAALRQCATELDVAMNLDADRDLELLRRAEADVRRWLALDDPEIRAAIEPDAVSLLYDAYMIFAAYDVSPDHMALVTSVPAAVVETLTARHARAAR